MTLETTRELYGDRVPSAPLFVIEFLDCLRTADTIVYEIVDSFMWRSETWRDVHACKRCRTTATASGLFRNTELVGWLVGV